ncbi:ArsR/SmtB family transcription factor [Streptococcus dentasini]
MVYHNIRKKETMNYQYHKHRSLIMDQLYFPNLLGNAIFTFLEDLTTTQKEQIKDIMALLTQFQQLLDPFKGRINRYFVMKEAIPFSDYLYRYLLEEGQDPQDMAEALLAFQTLSDESIQKLFLAFLEVKVEANALPQDALLEVLENSEISDEGRWRLLWAYHHPRTLIDGLVALYEDLIPLYQPFQKQYEEERDRFAQNLDLEKLFEGSEVIDFKGTFKNLRRETCEIFVMSPWHMFIVLTFDEQKPDKRIYFYIYPRVNLLVETERHLSDENMALTLRTLGDENRYRVLLELLKGDLKSKEIAEKLGITAANVSFHTQKLINAQLLLIKADKKGTTKYRLNKATMKLLLERLKEDFGL